MRKEKNRASAAASRARREAYTASLEEEVGGDLWPNGQCDLHRAVLDACLQAWPPVLKQALSL